MVTAHSMVSTSIGTHIDIQVNTSKIFKFIKVWVISKKMKPIEISQNIWAYSEEKPDLKLGEFTITSSGAMRSLIKEVKESGIFIDTGRRVRFNTNLWGEVWRIRPEHLALLQEKETQNEQATNRSISELQL
jgi:hypothetical protein